MYINKILTFILIHLTLKCYSTAPSNSNHSPSTSEVDHLIKDFERDYSDGGRTDHLLQNNLKQNHEAETSANINYSTLRPQYRHDHLQHPSSSMLHSNFQQDQDAALLLKFVDYSNIQPSYQQNESRHMLANTNVREQYGEASSTLNSLVIHATSVDDVFDEIFVDGIKKYHCKVHRNNQRCKSKVKKSRNFNSNLWKHLKLKHRQVHDALKAKFAETGKFVLNF
uniref:Uncharacterized protein n=1 Tax=Meloidogyne enterolobii TaxID=390850 RepID=A0A6V7VIA7_MELEN|nr:unnamed protein product [Meloidogyne enterolobii]